MNALPRRSNSPLTLYTRTLGASETAPGTNGIIDATGTKFWIKSCVQDFKLKLDNGESFDVDEGFFYEMEPGDFFKRIELINSNAAVQVVKIYVGAARVGRSSPQFMRVHPTYAGGASGNTSIAVDANYSVPGAAVGVHRKHLIVSNRATGAAATNTLDIYRASSAGVGIGTAMLFVGPRESKVIETSGNIIIRNPAGNAGAISTDICEIVYGISPL